MGNKKNGKRCCGGFGRLLTLEEALELMFGDICHVEVLEESGGTSEYEDVRHDIFSAMTDDERKAYDLVDQFVLAPKAGLPQDDDSLESRMEHAEWNTDAFRSELVHILADFESAVAYYSYVKTVMPDDETSLSAELEGIQNCIDEIKRYAFELELLIKIEEADFVADKASIMLNDAIDDREIYMQQLEDHYAQLIDDDGSELPEEDTESDSDGENEQSLDGPINLAQIFKESFGAKTEYEDIYDEDDDNDDCEGE